MHTVGNIYRTETKDGSTRLHFYVTEGNRTLYKVGGIANNKEQLKSVREMMELERRKMIREMTGGG